MFAKVLLPTDGSDNSLRAAEYVVNLMRMQPDIKVTVINVYHVPAELKAFDHEHPFAPGLVSSVREMSRRYIAKTVAVFEQAGFTVESESLEGDPAQVIVDYAAKGGFDHIVMGSRGAGQWSGLIFGSVTQKVIPLAPCPLILIR
ncbi:MAG: universal stress protein [Bacillota bacterium]